MFTGKDHTKTANADLSNRAGVFFQPKLTVNQPNDIYEQEADSMADRVMRMADPGHENAFFKPAQTAIQRKCQHCEEEEKVHRKEGSGAEAKDSPELDSYVGSLGSSGQALPESSRQFFEPRFGHDFSGVRIHTDSVATKSAQSINALAYTTGNNIVFNSGQYSPDSDSGKKLMAHELTHVVQQGGAIGRKIQRQATPATASTDVYICSKDLDTSPIGKHAFFRVGSPGSGNTTYSLQPVNQHLLDPDDLDRGERERNGDSEERYGVGCWQGVPDVNWPSDLNATGQCELSRISLSDLIREHGAYPVGHYCTLGPNSNTYVGHIARNCGVRDVDPPGWTPGIDDQPPPSGTFAPSRKYTLIAGCRTKECGHGM